VITVTDLKFSHRSGFKNRIWLAVAISLFSSAASAQTYPVSGVWVATDDRFPGSTGGACLILKQFGVDAVLAQPFPRLMIFSKDKRFEVRGIWIILAAAVVWAIYGDGVRSILKLPPASAHWAITQTNQNQPTATNLNEVVGLVKDLQASQQRTADEVRMTLQLLTSEQAATQAATKTVSDAVAALQAKVDALQRPVVPATKNPAPVAARKPPPAAARPAPEPEQPELEPPGPPARLVPR